jgi:hypothetical protein
MVIVPLVLFNDCQKIISEHSAVDAELVADFRVAPAHVEGADGSGKIIP